MNLSEMRGIQGRTNVRKFRASSSVDASFDLFGSGVTSPLDNPCSYLPFADALRTGLF
jgi:hypothetical protein